MALATHLTRGGARREAHWFNIIGLGLGPLFVGFLSDTFEPTLGAESIRYALLAVVVSGNAWSGVHYFLAARTLRADLKAKDGPIAA